MEIRQFYCPSGYGECENANGCVYPGRCNKGTDWTVARAKAELPELPVLFEHEVIGGQVSGRLLDFARVHYRNGHRTTTSVEVSWPTVARLLNNGAPLAV